MKNKLAPNEKDFSRIIELIQRAKEKAVSSVNSELIELYWNIGKYISKKIESEEWGKSIVEDLASYISKKHPDLKGYSDKNLWRMKQFYEAYSANTKLSTLLREISWSNNLLILSKTKSKEEREFYIYLTIKEKYSARELTRQINSSVFERQMLSNKKVSPVLTQLNKNISNCFKDTYVLDFLDLPKDHSEKDLQKGLIENFKHFVLEFGKDFAFVGQEYRVQVGKNDYYIDLLFYHRELRCLVLFELKTEEFKPEFLGKLNFYLEALDRDVKKKHENPSVGIILCTTKDSEVVEYALSRNLSPTMISEYKTKLIDKKLLEKKLHEFSQLNN